MKYKITLHEESFKKLQDYKAKLEKKELSPGKRLKDILGEKNISEMSDQEFLEAIVNTKIPRHFAEELGALDPWNKEEFSILGDTIISFPDAKVYDDGAWRAYEAKIHTSEFTAGIFVIPGALLANGQDEKNADFQEVTRKKAENPSEYEIDEDKYVAMMKRRILPSLLQANADAKINGKKAVISIPGIGCGFFADKTNHRDWPAKAGEALRRAITEMITDHKDKLQNIETVFIDAPGGPNNITKQDIKGIKLFTHDGNIGRIPQLTEPSEFMKKLGLSGDGKKLKLYKFIGGDHLSWPGNDQMAGSRDSDEGVTGAATNIIKLITGVEGAYDSATKKYNPSKKAVDSKMKDVKWNGGTWMQYIEQAGITISCKNENTEIYKSSGEFVSPIKKGEVKIYSAKPDEDNKYKLGIEFHSNDDRKNFKKRFLEFAKLQNVEINKIFEDSQISSNILYIKSSNGIGTMGAYLSNGNYNMSFELSINMGSDKLTLEFQKMLGIGEQAYCPDKSNAIYFKPNFLDPNHEKKSSIITQETFTKAIQAEELSKEAAKEINNPTTLLKPKPKDKEAIISYLSTANEDKIKIEFQNEKMRDAFKKQITDFAKSENIFLEEVVTNDSNDNNSLVIKYAHKIGSTGVYISESSKNLAIDIGKPEISKKFCELLGLGAVEVNINDGKIFFNELKPPQDVQFITTKTNLETNEVEVYCLNLKSCRSGQFL